MTSPPLEYTDPEHPSYGTVPSGGFSVIVTDCPWRYRNFSDKAHGAARAHYPGMTEGDLCRLRVDEWAADDCILAQWGTWPKLPQAVRLMEVWGFDYVTGIPWVKVTPKSGDIRRGVGFWTMGCSEFVLIGRKGKPVMKRDPSGTPIGLLGGEDQQFYAPRGKHSKKPEDIQDYLENRFSGPYLELFATRPRERWTCWGHDTGWHLHPGEDFPHRRSAAEEYGLIEKVEPPLQRRKEEGGHLEIASHGDPLGAAMTDF